eukprot:Lithocolla_globosa_v1_NODE_278_length_4688_cov_20.187567.p3 type:complete len:166 gc:universal NODE_278_length_4688_cov_20.187567:3554-4051(+)
MGTPTPFTKIINVVKIKFISENSNVPSMRSVEPYISAKAIHSGWHKIIVMIGNIRMYRRKPVPVLPWVETVLLMASAVGRLFVRRRVCIFFNCFFVGVFWEVISCPALACSTTIDCCKVPGLTPRLRSVFAFLLISGSRRSFFGGTWLCTSCTSSEHGFVDSFSE